MSDTWRSRSEWFRKVVDITEILRKEVTFSACELINREFIMTDAKIMEVNYRGERVKMAIISILGPDNVTIKYHTFSKVVIEQLEKLKPYLESGTYIKARLVMRGRYYQLV